MRVGAALEGSYGLQADVTNTTITGTSGSFYIDAFESRRFTYIGP